MQNPHSASLSSLFPKTKKPPEPQSSPTKGSIRIKAKTKISKDADAVAMKLVVVGAQGVGKSAFLGAVLSSSAGEVPFNASTPEVPRPLACENAAASTVVNSELASVHLSEISGLQETYDRTRPVAYMDADAVVVCFAVNDGEGLGEAAEKWVPEIRYFNKHVPIFLLGLKGDLRGGSENRGGEQTGVGMEGVVAKEQGEAMSAQIEALAYYECSAKTGEGVKEAFGGCVGRILETKMRDGSIEAMEAEGGKGPRWRRWF